jgi:hypothetical protein
MEVNRYFFSNKNIHNLLEQLCEHLGTNNKKAKKNCKVLLDSQMELVYNKNKSKVKRGNPKKMIKALNEKTFEQCMKRYEEHRRKSSGSNMDRDMNLYGSRKNRVEKRPKHTKMRKRDDDFPGMMDSSVNNSGFAPIGDGGFITATGESGDTMKFGNTNDQQFGYNDKQLNKELLERRMMERRSDYENNQLMSMGGGHMNPTNNMNSMNPMNGNQRPPEINFALDGGDTRGYGNSNPQMDQNMMMNNGGMMGQNQMMGQNMMMNMQQPMDQNMMMNMQQPMDQNMMNNNMQQPMDQNMMNNNMQQPMDQNMMNNNMQQPMDQNMYQNMINMNQNIQQPMMNNNTMNMNQNMGNNINDMNFDQRLEQLENDRNNIQPQMMNNNYNPNYNPNMYNQNMMSGVNNSNFQMGGDGGAADLMGGINGKKSKIANKLGLDPMEIMNMSANQIDDLVKNTTKKSKHQSNNSNNNSDSDSENSNKDIINMLLNLKKSNKGKSDFIKNSKKRIFKKDKKKKDKKKKKELSDKDNDSSNKYKDNDKETKNISVDIDCDDLCESDEFYSDYMIPFDNMTLDNVSGVSVDNGKFPILKTDITDDNNKLKIQIEDMLIPLELDNGTHKIEDLVSKISLSLQENNINIKISIVDDNKIKIEHLDETPFMIDCTEQSVMKLFGFTQDIYKDEYNYVSEEKYKLRTEPYFMYLENISSDNPIAKIDINGDLNMLDYNIDTPIEKLKGVIIQFKTEDNDLVVFNGDKHEYKLNFVCKN